MQEVTKIIYKMTDEISDLEEKIQKQYQYFGLSDAEENIARLIQNISEGNKITGTDFSKYKKARQIKQDWLKISLQKFQNLIIASKNIVDNLFIQLENNIAEQHLRSLKKYDFSNIQSEILTTEKQKKILEKMMSYNQIVIQLEKIYSLDKHSKIESLLVACDKRQNLLLIIENSYKKKFGVFARCKFENGNAGGKIDKTDSSFVFSIDLEVKQKLDEERYAIKIFNQPGNKWIRYGLLMKPDTLFAEISLKNQVQNSMLQNTFIDIPNSSFQQLNGYQGEKDTAAINKLEVYAVSDYRVESNDSCLFDVSQHLENQEQRKCKPYSEEIRQAFEREKYKMMYLQILF